MSLRASDMIPDASTSSCSCSDSDSNSSSSSSGEGEGGEKGGRGAVAERVAERREQSAALKQGDMEAAAAVVASFRDKAQQQERQQQRSIRRATRQAHVYRWGGVRHWQVQRGKVLVQRQLQLIRVLELHRQAEQEVRALATAQQQRQRGVVLDQLVAACEPVVNVMRARLALRKAIAAAAANGDSSVQEQLRKTAAAAVAAESASADALIINLQLQQQEQQQEMECLQHLEVSVKQSGPMQGQLVNVAR